MPGLTVLHVLEAAGHGTGRHVVDLVTHAEGVAHEVVLPRRPTPRGEDRTSRTADELHAAGVVVHEVPLRRSPLHPDLPRAVAAVRRLVRVRGADVVHGHATVGGVVARVAGRATGRPVVVTPNGVHPSRAVRTAERSLARWTDALVAVSSSEADLVVELGLCPRDRVHLIPNGIRLDPPSVHAPRDLRAELGVPTGASLVGWVGRLAPQKAPEVLVDALAQLPATVHAILVGGGPDHDAVVDHVRRADLTDRVHLLGHVPAAASLLGQLDVLALPSRWEGAPYVPLEAFRAGVPVVATDVVGTRDVVVDGRTGWLVPPDDAAALASALREALADHDETRRRASLARERLVAHHDVRAMGAATVQVYEGLTSNQRDNR